MPTLYLTNDNIIELDGLQNAVTEAYINDATVSVTLTNAAGSEVSGETWPLSMAYVSASNGKYRATLVDTLTLTAGAVYTATVTANAGASGLGTWQETLVAQVRQG